MSNSNTPPKESITDDDSWKGYDLQIALDQLASGSTEALKVFLARKHGLDPNTVSLRSGPWTAKEDAQYSALGPMDDTGPPGETAAYGNNAPRLPPPPVVFEETDTAYDYEPLEPEHRQFRLLRLGPTNEDGVVRRLHLETFSLEDAPPYFCLSYVWGDPNRFLDISCDGKTILCTQNLYHALQPCFHRHPDCWLWADGICINQDDVAERSSQVLLMGSIYERARMVLAHPGHYRYARREPEPEPEAQKTALEERMGGLGMQDMMSFGVEDVVEEDDTASRGEKSQPAAVSNAYSSHNAQTAVSIMTFLTRSWWGQSRDRIRSDRDWDRAGLPDPATEEGREIWGNLVGFWMQDWFFRTWVLQEVVLPAKVVILYEETAISLGAVTDFWHEARRNGLPRVLRIGPYADIFNQVMHLSPCSSFKVLRDRRHKSGESNKGDDHDGGDDGPEIVDSSMPSLFELLCLSRNNLATDPRDKVYGLLGLTDDAVSKAIIPDYSPENSVADVFTEVAAAIVEDGGAADLLHHAGVDQQIPGMPSWVPDWTIQSRSNLPAHLYQCMGKSSPTASVLKNDDGKPKLAVRGAVISRVNHVGPAWKYYSHDNSQAPFGAFESAPELEIPPFNDEDARNFILSFATNSEEDVGERYKDEGFRDALARTLTADSSWEGARIGRRDDKPGPKPNDGEGATRSTSAEFFDGLEAFGRFYARGPESEEDLTAPGIRVHQTMVFKWLLDFGEDVEADLQRRMVPFTVPFQEAQRGRRFATLGTRGPTTAEDDEKPQRRKRNTKALEHNFMATVPWDAEIEDYVVVLEGFRTPFVLRKAKDALADEYEAIGDCYVHGIMDGELLQLAEDVEEKLGPEFFSRDGEGREYAIRAPQGFVPFTSFKLI
ncbi:ankyrin and het domain-containing protein [Colletotrichum musicola]|uniref:Ankyrin and het domain-containing protein n=1 Tax=Colletotrichum musicola TaxID=2175873 RepID=A0A8H6NNA9_9PEZI|nr:ankyrin and het domain-containing protein [Colletotrichum musicola]